MEDIVDQELSNYWEPSSFLQNEDFEYDRSWPLEEAISGSYDSSSPDGAASSPASKNIVSERNRRQKLNQRLFALRSVVPNITKMDKASIIKDAISYIEGLQYEEKKLEAEIRELESTPKSSLSFSKDFDRDLLVPVTSKKMKQLDSGSSTSLIEVLELKVTFMGERTMVVSVTCNKRTDTMVKLCEVFESLNLKILTSNLTSFSGMIFHTVFIELRPNIYWVVWFLVFMSIFGPTIIVIWSIWFIKKKIILSLWRMKKNKRCCG
ncbi:basic helix-loop-helix (bHLH) DNA-binding superfamily protein [Arabidopsis thaliana]|uniref:Basic helix-loop-helix (BHLH) DNA-binding superfamily protein n=1 Tax=Arabidopsis thaliana TaxID=3702 RepID=F4KAJ5_ARATH|nr:basic helix-loop-helix (bHLH) DNA-binding superfamily protein [Arabidopsis thaliana]AED96856.1 basic helix-loop-helix (bHLH) DNA-binding superfamily protein [Arabidopsis thaliana]|eukprot:NP_001190556.1 basic helix-loop-helix (bHLH) DNA-binding superfamily protein [Arabidopsis thaliana]